MKKLIALSTIALTACGTVFNGSSQDIKFDSNIQGVDIYINGMKACKTPCVYPIERHSSTVVVMAKKQGYQTQQTIVKSELSGIAILNLTFWPSWLTDVATGGMWKYARDGIYIEMEAEHQRKYSQTNKKDKEIRRFALYNYQNIKEEALHHQSGEYIKSLSFLTNKDEQTLIKIANNSFSEVNLAHTLTGIE